MKLPNWRYMGKDVTDISQLNKPNLMGFVYEITTESGKFYIGKKNVYSTRKKKLGKKELALLTDKRLKKYKVVVQESDWKTYIGSNKELLADIKNGEKIKSREILHVCATLKELTYFETKHLFCNDVLLSDNYFNDNILGKFFRKDLGHDKVLFEEEVHGEEE